MHGVGLTTDHEQICVTRRWGEHECTRDDILGEKTGEWCIEWSVTSEEGGIWEDAFSS